MCSIVCTERFIEAIVCSAMYRRGSAAVEIALTEANDFSFKL